MKMLWAAAAVGIAGLSSLALLAKVSGGTDERPAGSDRMHVVLIGASIGKTWNLPGLPQRAQNDRYSFDALQVWDYDKSEAVEETLMRPARKFRVARTYVKGFFQPAPKPADLVILKECSSYFPGDIQLMRKRELLQQWVQEVRAKGTPVMVTTVAPITRSRAERDGPVKHQAIREFNDWVRAYTREQQLPLLDLEKALRTDDSERYLRDEYTSGDGSHLNRAAYDVLDRVMLDALCEFNGASCRPTQARAK